MPEADDDDAVVCVLIVVLFSISTMPRCASLSSVGSGCCNGPPLCGTVGDGGKLAIAAFAIESALCAEAGTVRTAVVVAAVAVALLKAPPILLALER